MWPGTLVYINFTLLAYAPEQICLPHCTYISNYISTVMMMMMIIIIILIIIIIIIIIIIMITRSLSILYKIVQTLINHNYYFVLNPLIDLEPTYVFVMWVHGVIFLNVHNYPTSHILNFLYFIQVVLGWA